MEPTQNTSLFQLNLDANNSYALRGAASWAKVLAIIGLIFGILFVAIGFLIRNYQSEFAGGLAEGYEGFRGNQATAANLGMAVYLVLGLVFIISSIFALSFGNRVSRGLRTNDQGSLGGGFSALRNYFAFWSILMILMLLLTIVGVAGMVSGMR